MQDALGDRIKSSYENRQRVYLSRRNYTIIRVDGKAFSTYTKHLKRPFDEGFMEDMDLTAAYLCKNIVGAKFAFVQSDEISILLTDFEDMKSEAWFDNNLQKMCSVSASMAAAHFNHLRLLRSVDSANFQKFMTSKMAEFDSRVFQIPQKTEVENYFIWRQQDTTKNSISSVARSLYSHKELNGKHSNDLQEMIFQKGINWNDLPTSQKRGRIILKETYEKKAEENEKSSSIRTRWTSVEIPIFTQDRSFLTSKIPDNV